MIYFVPKLVGIPSCFLKATDRDTVSTKAGVHTGTGTKEAEVPDIGARNGTRPIVAEGANNEKRAIRASAAACQGQFKR